jgi:hypothetical protein
MNYPKFLHNRHNLIMPKTRSRNIEKICESIARKNKICYGYYNWLDSCPLVYRAQFIDKSYNALYVIIEIPEELPF